MIDSYSFPHCDKYTIFQLGVANFMKNNKIYSENSVFLVDGFGILCVLPLFTTITFKKCYKLITKNNNITLKSISSNFLKDLYNLLKEDKKAFKKISNRVWISTPDRYIEKYNSNRYILDVLKLNYNIDNIFLHLHDDYPAPILDKNTVVISCFKNITKTKGKNNIKYNRITDITLNSPPFHRFTTFINYKKKIYKKMFYEGMDASKNYFQSNDES